MKNIIAFLCAAIFGIISGFGCGSAFAVTEVTDCTMEPNYLQGEHVLLSCLPEETDMLERGQVVMFENHLYKQTGESSMMLKRIVGLPGEQIQISCGVVYVDGNPLPDLWTGTYGRGNDTMEARIVPEDSYFVLGDNRRRSTDSRDETVGMIKKDEIIGKVIRQW